MLMGEDLLWFADFQQVKSVLNTLGGKYTLLYVPTPQLRSPP